MYNFCKIALRHFHQQIPETILVQLQHPWKDMTKEERDAAPLQVKVSQEQHILYELGKLFGQMEYNQILDVSEDHPDNDKYLLYQKTLGILRGYGLINDHTPLIMKIFGITEDNVAWRGFSFCSPREFLTPLKKIRMEVKREYAKKIIPVTKLAREPFPGYSRTIALTQMSQWLFKAFRSQKSIPLETKTAIKQVKRGKKAKDEVEIVHGASPRELWKKCGFNLADFPMYRVEYRAQLTDEEQKFLKGQHLLWDIRNYQSADDRPNIFDIQLVYPTKSTIPSRINVDSQARDAILKFWPEYSQKYILKEVASK